MSTRLTAALLVVALATAASPAQTALGTAFTYQGRLNQAGQPFNGTADLLFELYDAASGGSLLGSQTLSGVVVSDGLFTVQLNGGGQFGASAFTGEQRWLKISVNGTPLSPRQELTAAPHALFASNADLLDGLDSTAFLQSTPIPLTLIGTSATHIIRAENASTGFLPMAIYGLCTGASGGTTGVRGESASTSGRGVIGFATATTGTTYGGQFESTSTSGTGIQGVASASTGTTYGAYGQSASTSGRGIYGEATAATGSTRGVYGVSDSTGGRGVQGYATATSGTTYGVLGRSDSPDGYGVYGQAVDTAGINYGVYGVSASTSGLGVFGWASANTGLTYGGRFESNSDSGRGVFGTATAVSGLTYGVYGRSESGSGRGVYGLAAATGGAPTGVWGQSDSTFGRGVYGWASSTTGTIYGVVGEASQTAAGYAVYGLGDMGASGVKSFRIDHPDDPANKYLLHYAAESPEVINFYSGKVTLDGAGEAVVELPHYFAKINKDPRYTLTAVGAPMPMLHVAEEIDEAALSAGATAGPDDVAPACSFRIAGGAPGAKVSWRIEALRNDRWVQQRGAPVEVEKQGPERGTYQHPDLYGQPPEMGMNYDAECERPSPGAPPEATAR